MFKKIRIAVLLLVLLIVGLHTWRSQAQAVEWDDSLRVAIYPINADGSAVTAAYIAAVAPERYRQIELFFAAEAARYNVALNYNQPPLRISIAQEVKSLPPEPPADGGVFATIYWSLRLRYWASDNDDIPNAAPPQVRLFVVFHDPALSPRVPHSLGLQKGLIGVVHAFATDAMQGQNNVVIAHELLHTLGATDKYDSANTLPRFPDGYAAPERSPRYPQPAAELMGGRIPRSPTEAWIPQGLWQVVVGQTTAKEIGWVR